MLLSSASAMGSGDAGIADQHAVAMRPYCGTPVSSDARFRVKLHYQVHHRRRHVAHSGIDLLSVELWANNAFEAGRAHNLPATPAGLFGLFGH